jgi:hypothetical protein
MQDSSSRGSAASADATRACSGELTAAEIAAARPTEKLEEPDEPETPARPKKLVDGQFWPRVTITIEGKEHAFLTNKLLDVARDMALSRVYGTIVAAEQTVTIAVDEG